jgi:hypothetical protein
VTRATCSLIKLFAALGTGSACVQVLGVADFSYSGRGEFDGQLPILVTPGCWECISTTCATEVLASCEASESCTQYFALQRAATSEQPLIASRDLLRLQSDLYWEADHGNVTWSTAFGQLNICGSMSCADSCPVRRSFGCVDRFEWPVANRVSARLRIHIRAVDPDAPLAGVTIKACVLGSDCGRPIGVAIADEGGFAELDLDLNNRSPNTQLADFRGSLVFDAGSDFYPKEYRQSSPMFDQWFHDSILYTREAFAERPGISQLALESEASQSFLGVRVVDCDGLWAKDAELEVWEHDAQGLTPCRESTCQFLYAMPDEGSRPATNMVKARAPSAEIVLPAGHEFMIVARDSRSRHVIGYLPHVKTRPGYEHSLVIGPASKEEFAVLPTAVLRPE